MYMVVVSHQTRGRVGVLDDASAVHFNLLDEVLNIPLHGVPVRFDRAKLNMVLAATRFETVVILNSAPSLHTRPWEYAPKTWPARPGAAKCPHVCEC